MPLPTISSLEKLGLKKERNKAPKSKTSSWFDGIIWVFCCSFMILALSKMVLDSPFSFFIEIPVSGGQASLHTLTVFMVSFTFLFFWTKVLKKTPSVYRILLAIAFTLAGYVVYDFQWTIFLILNAGNIGVDLGVYGFIVIHTEATWGIQAIFAALWLTIPSTIIISLKIKKPQYVPRIPIKRFVLVVLCNFLLILWLSTSDFYTEFYTYWGLWGFGIVYPEPHGWVWFIGKALGMLSWLLVFIKFNINKGKLRNRLAHWRLFKY